MTDTQNPSDNPERVHPRTWQDLTDQLPTPADPADSRDLIWQQLAAYFRWYDRAATRNRLSYQIIKVSVLTAGAAVTVLAATGVEAAITASVAATIVVLEGIQQLFQFQSNWISYRATAEKLRAHAFAYAANAAPYDNPTTRRSDLGQLLRELAATENLTWTNAMRDTSNFSTGPS